MSWPNRTAGPRPDIGRAVARLEANRKESDIQPLLDGLKGALLQWRGE